MTNDVKKQIWIKNIPAGKPGSREILILTNILFPASRLSGKIV